MAMDVGSVVTAIAPIAPIEARGVKFDNFI